MNTTREDKTRRTNATTEKIEKTTLSWQRERFANVSVFFLCFARGKSAVFARFAFVSLVVLQVCVVENLKGKVSLSLSLCLI
jgi:hypothetical protein